MDPNLYTETARFFEDKFEKNAMYVPTLDSDKMFKSYYEYIFVRLSG